MPSTSGRRRRDPLRLPWPRALAYYGAVLAVSAALVWATVILAEAVADALH